MKNRRFPYGYEMQNGLIVICLKEVDTVKQIKLKNNKIIRKEMTLNDANTACTEIG